VKTLTTPKSKKSSSGCNVAPYIPTPAEIRAECSDIQQSWSEEEMMRRQRVTRPTKFAKQVYRIHLDSPDMESYS